MMELRDSHIFEKHPESWYVEPLDVDRALIKALAPALPKGAMILDPCCGFGRIVRAAHEQGYDARGNDIVPRWRNNPDGPFSDKVNFSVCDYFDHKFMDYSGPYDAVIMNPPYGQTIAFVDKALGEARRLVAAIVPATWINGARTARWLIGTPWTDYWPISPRPSMPPGEYLLQGRAAGGGTKDFAILVWKPLAGVTRGKALLSHLFWRD